ncbi:hypothetical protein BDZ89DRAFT_1104642 [Hymenopellis radicata]|nr:hypothetical protein BDZ89DRAFT_1104642 [Hymenopellis radicata]
MSSSFVNPSSISESGPSRKRPRSDVSSEERKEARAHRNRIAAQNSRDRRKAQFCQLERRVQELEEENRQLRAGYGLAQATTPPPKSPEQAARDRENEELKERIKTLEKGWDAVVKALAAQGLPGNTGGDHWRGSAPCPADVPAAGGLDSLDLFAPINFPQSPSHLQDTAVSPVDDATMETLFREILATSPAPTQEASLLPLDQEAPVAVSEMSLTFEDAAGKGTPGSLLLSGSPEDLAWPHEELDVQRLLDLLPIDSMPMDSWEFSLDSTAVGVY